VCLATQLVLQLLVGDPAHHCIISTENTSFAPLARGLSTLASVYCMLLLCSSNPCTGYAHALQSAPGTQISITASHYLIMWQKLWPGCTVCLRTAYPGDSPECSRGSSRTSRWFLRFLFCEFSYSFGSLATLACICSWLCGDLLPQQSPAFDFQV
jgi:hypothetical protein